MSKRVFAAMSGGVDSAAAALLLLQAGCDVTGVTLRLHSFRDRPGLCGSADDIETARAVAAALGIPHVVLDLRELFREKVMDRFVWAYTRGPHAQPLHRLQPGDQVRRPAGLGPGPGGGRPCHRPLCPGAAVPLRPLAAAAGRGPAEGPDLFPLPADPAPALPSAAAGGGL